MMEELEYTMLENYAKQNDYVNEMDLFEIVNLNPLLHSKGLKEFSQMILSLQNRYMIEPDESGHSHKIMYNGIVAFYLEKEKRSKQENDERLQRDLVKTSISNNKWTPIFAGISTVFVIIATINTCNESLNISVRLYKLEQQYSKDTLHNHKASNYEPKTDSNQNDSSSDTTEAVLKNSDSIKE